MGNCLPPQYRPAVHCGDGSAYPRRMSHLNAAAALLQTHPGTQWLADVTAPDNTPPGIFLRIYIFGGLAAVIGIAWFCLRGYRDSGDNDNK